MTIKVLEKLDSAILKDPNLFVKRFNNLFANAIDNIQGYYIEETPVDTSNLRNLVQSKIAGYTGTVKTTASYAEYVHGGEGKYKGGADRGRTNGHKTNYSEEDITFFKILRSRGVVFNIKPNKFAYRAFIKTKDKLPKYFYQALVKIINS